MENPKTLSLTAFFIALLLAVNLLFATDIQDTRTKVVAAAKEYLGCPYQRGATGPEKFDCSGLIFSVMKDIAGVQLPRSARDINSAAQKIERSQLEPGDLVFFKTIGNGTISHIGIYIGQDQFIHSASAGPKTGVIISSLNEKYYAKTFAGAGRVL